MNFIDFIRDLEKAPGLSGRAVHIEEIPPRKAQYGHLARRLPSEVKVALERMEIRRLYIHQAKAINLAREGKNVVIATSTASGKTLCYNIPVAERLVSQESARALYIFPTKALAQDQLRALGQFARDIPSLGQALKAGTYDGDTPSSSRKKVRQNMRIVLTNPDMLHQAILPYHAKWADFFEGLSYIVVDEIHQYRGIFGSHVANVFRRLRRVCTRYGADPAFVCCSATISNPKQLAERLIAEDMELVGEDGSPQGKKYFVLWNPPLLPGQSFMRKSSNVEAKEALVELVKHKVPTIVFANARVVAELIYRYAYDALKAQAPSLAERLSPYRGGYLPSERREIEKKLFSGELLAVTTTSALELGIDVGTLEACIMVGFPGSIASTWQRAGRAGRRSDESLVMLVAYDDPIDQYFMKHPQYLFGESVEEAIIEAENKYILASHLGCAAFEVPVGEGDERGFGSMTMPIAEALAESGVFKQSGDRFYWSSADFPASKISLRTISSDTYAILEKIPEGVNTLGQVDSISAPELLYPGAVYMHRGETYLVRRLDTEGNVAHIEKAEVDYYTQPILDSSVRVLKMEKDRRVENATVCFGDVDVRWATAGFKKVQFYSGNPIGYGKLDLPSQNMETKGFWIVPDRDILEGIAADKLSPAEGLWAVRNLLLVLLPVLSGCDRSDLRGTVNLREAGSPAIFVYDWYLGGLGLTERAYERAEELLRACRELIADCSCEDGCPSCVGFVMPSRPLHQDPDLSAGKRIPSKAAARALLNSLA